MDNLHIMSTRKYISALRHLFPEMRMCFVCYIRTQTIDKRVKYTHANLISDNYYRVQFWFVFVKYTYVCGYFVTQRDNFNDAYVNQEVRYVYLNNIQFFFFFIFIFGDNF